MSEWLMASEMMERLGLSSTQGVAYRAARGLLEVRMHPTLLNRKQYREKTPSRQMDEAILDDQAEVPIEELIARRVRVSRRARASNEKRREVVRIEREGPFAICHMGDPHVDDDGCDWDQLITDVEVVQRTEGMYAGNVGDTINNWVGKLIGKYKQQTTSEDEAFRLGKWLFQEIPWDYIILGNHDHWNQGGPLFREFAAGADIKAFADHEARIEYVTPSGESFRLDVRHDFKGNSMWNNVHGPMKRSKLRPWGDLYVCGHKHTWGYHVDEQELRGPVWSMRVRGYKRNDEYAEAKDFAEDAHGCSLTTVIDPDNDHPGERCKVFHDVEQAAAWLEWLRSR